MRQKKVSHKRHLITAQAEQGENGLWVILVGDRSGSLGERCSTVARANVARTAVRHASMKLGIPEGKIKLDRVTYS